MVSKNMVNGISDLSFGKARSRPPPLPAPSDGGGGPPIRCSPSYRVMRRSFVPYHRRISDGTSSPAPPPSCYQRGEGSIPTLPRHLQIPPRPTLIRLLQTRGPFSVHGSSSPVPDPPYSRLYLPEYPSSVASYIPPDMAPS